MTSHVIEIENLGKSYKLGESRPDYAMLRDVIARLVRLPLTRLRKPGGNGADSDLFWALRGVSLTVNQGEVVGIIGRNGAGKSTLLKILSRITEPTTGEVKLHGRVASLLEVGTGFHPELTGRENVYLNGAMLGMKAVEIARKFDEIVAFAEIERFLDTPVKRYSSGMYVRLAFAVAAHLEPEILIVDEVLAVGDAAFQAKCLGKMREVSRASGRTVLFVSHNMSAVARLCDRGILLEGGTVAADTSAENAVALYANRGRGLESDLQANGVKLRISFLDKNGEKLLKWATGEELRMVIQVVDAPQRRLAFDFALYSEFGARVFSFQSDRIGHFVDCDGPSLCISLSNIGLACTEISVDVGVREPGYHDYTALWQSITTLSTASNRPEAITSVPYLVDLPFTVTNQDA